MPRPTADEIITKKHVRYFIQPEGAGPANDLLYSGKDNTYLNIDTTDNPQSGGISPVNVHSPTRVGKYRRVARKVDPADFPTATVQFLQKKDVLPRHLTHLQTCQHNIYAVVGDCRDLSDFDNGWTAYIKVHENGEVTDQSEMGGAFEADDQLQDELSFTFSSVYNVGKLGFSERASSEVYSEVIDITYGNREQCDNCGPEDNGTKTIYAVTNNVGGSPGEAPVIYYSTNVGVLFTQLAITGAVAADVPVAIAVVGRYLIVVFDDGATGGYFYTEINNITGVPGTTWTKVTTGFVDAKAPQDVFVASAGEVWFCGDGGYIYKATVITSGVSASDAGDTTAVDLKRIHGQDEVIVTSGASGTVVYTNTRGSSWTAATATPAATNLDGLSVVGDYLWWVGDDAGDVFYSSDQGASWVDAAFPSDVATVQDIVFITESIGFIATATAGPLASIWATMNGGRTWREYTSAANGPRILNLPVFDRANRLAFPEVSNPNIATNYLAVAGLGGDGTDGIILTAAAGLL